MRAVRAGWLIAVATGVAGSGCPSFTQAPGVTAEESGDGDGVAADTGANDDTSGVADGQGTLDATSGAAPATESDDDSGEASDGGDAVDTMSGPVCPNNIVEDGEECDDGNRVDDDACSNTCVAATCEDGVANGTETDVDCGGADCPVCAAGSACAVIEDCAADLVCAEHTGICQLPASCLHVLQLDPTAKTGAHLIDPNGDGETIQVVCDMGFDDGGWTRISSEFFHDGIDPGWSTTLLDDCGGHDAILGGVGVLGTGDTIVREANMLGVPHAEVRVRIEWVFVDSWDGGEYAFVQYDGVEVHQMPWDMGMAPSNLCGAAIYNDSNALSNAVGPSVTDDLTITFGTTLNQDADDESWGLDMVQIFVR